MGQEVYDYTTRAINSRSLLLPQVSLKQLNYLLYTRRGNDTKR